MSPIFCSIEKKVNGENQYFKVEEKARNFAEHWRQKQKREFQQIMEQRI